MTDLASCPFCGGSAAIEERRLSPTMKGPGAIISVTVRHFCPRPDGVVGGSIKFRGRDHASAVAAWNARYNDVRGKALTELQRLGQEFEND